MFAGVSLSSLIIKQRSPLFCRLKGFPNLINTGRNNNNKSINNGNMASSVLSYFLQSREHGWMRGGKSCARGAHVAGFPCVDGAEGGGGTKNYRGDDIHCSLRVITRRLSIPRPSRWSTQVKRMPCVSSVFTLKDGTQTSKRATVTIAWPPDSLSVHRQTWPDSHPKYHSQTPLHSHARAHRCLSGLLTSWSPSHSPAGLSFTPCPRDHPRQHPERDRRGEVIGEKATVIVPSVADQHIHFPNSGRFINKCTLEEELKKQKKQKNNQKNKSHIVCHQSFLQACVQAEISSVTD